jgi:ABC-type nitrate/sulfonate/bicarbonate transport system substrate-binding protein
VPRRLSWLAWIALLALACQAPPAPRAAEPLADAASPAPLTRLRVAIVSPNESFSITWVGRDSGIFLRHGFDVEIPVVTGSPRLVQSLIAGDFEYAMMGSTALLRARLQGADPLILATSANVANHNVMVRPDTGIRQLADLKGRVVGVSQIGSEADTFLRLALGSTGLTADDVSIIQTGGSPQTVAAMLSGNLDVGVFAGANVVRAQQTGISILASSRELNVPALNGLLATTQRYIDRDRNSVARFMRAWVEAVHYFKTDRAGTLRILQANLAELDQDELAYLYDEMNEYLAPLPLPSEAAIQAMLDREEDPQARNHRPSEFVDTSFLREIEQSGGQGTSPLSCCRPRDDMPTRWPAAFSAVAPGSAPTSRNGGTGSGTPPHPSTLPRAGGEGAWGLSAVSGGSPTAA